MGIAEKFKALTDNLRTTDDKVISQRCQRITKRINLDFWGSDSETNHSRYLGSYGRGTDIRGHSDIDLAIHLPWSIYVRYNAYRSNGQSALLQAVKQSVEATYSSTEIGGDGQVVVVKFIDGIKFELLPVFMLLDGSFTYPDSNSGGSWRYTNPVLEIDSINKANLLCNKNLKRLARMTRAWKQRNIVPIKGLLIDTLAYNFIKQWPHRYKSFLYYDYMIRDFMQYLSEMDREQEYWCAPGSGERVFRTGLFEYKATQACKTALEAIEYETSNKTDSANQKWREIFGGFFP